MTADNAPIRASDADRDRTATSLREHYAAGRLTEEEFSQRLDVVYAATTLAELRNLQADLPGPDLSPLSRAEPSPPVATGPPARFSPGWRAAWTSWLTITAVSFVIWLFSGASGSLWFLWPTGIFGALLLAHWISGAPAPDDRRSARRQQRGHRHRHWGPARQPTWP